MSLALLPGLSFLLGLILPLTAAEAAPPKGAEVKDAPELGKYFAERKAIGTFVMLELSNHTLVAFNTNRASQQFIPASTFKIANTLIGLDAGAVKSVDEVLPYGGRPQPFKEWEHDMPLREAIRLSAVPIYQELARRIGVQRMSSGVKKLGYGNQEIGTVIDRFWLDGPLEISAVEQAEFLSRLVQGKLPVSPEALVATKEITLQEKTNEYELHYKTGWVFGTKPQIGWVVGWVSTANGTSTFALNMDMAGQEDTPKRVPLAKECLKALGKLN